MMKVITIINHKVDHRIYAELETRADEHADAEESASMSIEAMRAAILAGDPFFWHELDVKQLYERFSDYFEAVPYAHVTSPPVVPDAEREYFG